MEKSVLLSIHPKWCKRIADGSKTIEVRKTKPKLDIPFKVYIYCTKDNAGLIPSRYWWKADKTGFQHILNGKVIGEFVCDKVDYFSFSDSEWAYSVAPAGSKMPMHETTALRIMQEQGCLSLDDINAYFGDEDYKAYFWHISNLVIYDKPRDLDYFRKPIDCHRGKDRENCKGCWDCEITRPPQSWCYVSDTGINTSKGEN